MSLWDSLKDKYKENAERAIKIFKSNYGRDYGWYIELNNHIIGELQNPVQIEMFWESYKIIPKDENYKDLLNSSNFWLNQDLKFRNKGLDKYANFAFPGGISTENKSLNGQVAMRALYLTYDSPLEESIAYFYKLFYHKKSDAIKFSSTKFKLIKISYRNANKLKSYELVINASRKISLITNSKKRQDNIKDYWVQNRKIIQIQNIIDKYKLFNIKQYYLNDADFKTRIKNTLNSKKLYVIQIWNHTDEEPKELILSLNYLGKNIENEMVKKAIEEIEQIVESGNVEDVLIS